MTVILGGSSAVNVVAQGRRIRLIDRQEPGGPSGTQLLSALLQGRRRTTPITAPSDDVNDAGRRSPAGSSVLGRACGCTYC